MQCDDTDSDSLDIFTDGTEQVGSRYCLFNIILPSVSSSPEMTEPGPHSCSQEVPAVVV